MPETASPSLDVTISEIELPHLYRTFLSLLILWKGADINENPYEVADLVTHVWYSYKWPQRLVEFVSKVLAQQTEDLACKINSAFSLGPRPETECFINTWGSDKLHLEAGFNWIYWEAILNYMVRPKHRDSHVLRDNDVRAYGEPLDRAFARMPPSRVAGLVKWRQNGLMLAHGDSALPYSHLNPIFFPAASKLPNGFTNEPLSEWPMNEILDYAPHAADRDVYGKMAAYVREMLVKFQLRLQKKGVSVRLMSAGTVSMVGYLRTYCEQQPKFDRIEAGHLFDINPEICFLSFSPLLRHEEENPFATLLIMTRENFTKAKSPRLRKLIAAEKTKIFQPVSESLDSIAPPVQSTGNLYSADCVHRHFALQVFDRKWDMFSDCYLADASLFGFQVPANSEPKRSIFQTGWLGLQFKQKNTVKARWPNRLVYGGGAKALTEEDASRLRRWMSWSTTKPERWLEWKKVKDITWFEWSVYCQMAQDSQDYGVNDLERMYGFVANEKAFLWAEKEYEYCSYGCDFNKCEHEHEQESATVQDPTIPIEQQSTISSDEEANDESWMQMDPAEGSAAGGTAKKSKKKKKKKKAGRR
ncbi:hypothetical protein ACSS6W_008402 [Trichoderma asperelloides]